LRELNKLAILEFRIRDLDIIIWILKAFGCLSSRLKNSTSVPPVENSAWRRPWLVYPKSNVLTAKVRVFIDYLLEKIGDTPVWVDA